MEFEIGEDYVRTIDEDGKKHVHVGLRGERLKDELLATFKDISDEDIARAWHRKTVSCLDVTFLWPCGCEEWHEDFDWEESRSMTRVHECQAMPSLSDDTKPRFNIVRSFVFRREDFATLNDSVVPTPCGCMTEPDGRCEHGVKAWTMLLGAI